MRSLTLATAILLSAVSPLAAKENPAAQQLLDTAPKPTDLFEHNSQPFQMQVDFTIQLQVPTQGHFLMKWKSKDQWWTKLILGRFQQITINNGEMRYTSRNVSFTPLRVRELFDLIQFMQPIPTPIAEKQKNRLENNLAITCVEARFKEVKSNSLEFCLDQTSHELLSENWENVPDEKSKRQFSDYFGFNGVRYPRKLQYFESGSKIISAEVIKLEALDFDSSLLIPPSGSIERRFCGGMKPPVPLKTPQPEFPSSSSIIGDSAVSLTILTDGTVGDIQLTGRGGQTLDNPTLAALRKWKFKPAMCGTEPVVADLQVVVSRRIHN